jgi:hypothetical protein
LRRLPPAVFTITWSPWTLRSSDEPESNDSIVAVLPFGSRNLAGLAVGWPITMRPFGS